MNCLGDRFRGSVDDPAVSPMDCLRGTSTTWALTRQRAADWCWLKRWLGERKQASDPVWTAAPQRWGG